MQRLSRILALGFKYITYISSKEIYIRNLPLLNTIFQNLNDAGKYSEMWKTMVCIVIPKIERTNYRVLSIY
jgi:hypothetical protein